MNTKQQSKKGFTLIELLVVIAIIGILAALVLVALGSARDKANDTRVKSGISQLRTLAETIYDSDNSSYSKIQGCFSTAAPVSPACAGQEAAVTKLVADVNAANSTSTGTSVAAVSNGTAYCVTAKLKSNSSQYFCADSTGIARVTSSTCSTTTNACQ